MKRYLQNILLAGILFWSNTAFAQVTPGPPIAENQGVRLGVYKVLNCSTNMTCALTNNILSISSAGGGGGVTNVTASSPLSSTGGATPDISALQPFVLASPNSGGYYIELNQNTPAIVRMGVEDGSGGGGSIFTGDSINAGVFGTRTNHPVEFFQNDTKRMWLDTSGNLNLSGSVVAGTWAGTAIGNTKGGTGVDSSGFTGLALVTGGVWSAYGGATSCTNQFFTGLSASGASTCTTATLASAQFANQGTTTTVLHGAAAGNPSFGSIVSNDMNITTTSCTNQVVSAISAGGVGTCHTIVAADTSGLGTVTSVATTSPITGGTITGTGTIACATCVTSAAALTSSEPVIGQGLQATAVGTRSGNTTVFVTTTGTQTNGDCVKIDASGNHIANGSACGGAGGYSTIQDEGTSLTQRATANFIGSGITCTDDAGNTRTNCTVNLGTLLDQQNITATGAGTWNKVSGAAMVLVRACGAGGSGGGGSAAGTSAVAAGGGGGGGGACAERWFLASDLGTTESYSVGAGAGTTGGGSGTSGSDGGAGGNTSFGTTKLIGYGGGGGAGNNVGAASGSGGGGSQVGQSAATTTGVSGGACGGPGSASGAGNSTCAGAGGAAAGGSGANGNTSALGGGSGGASATDGSATSLAGGSSLQSAAGGAAGGGVTSGNATENGGVGGDSGWSVTGSNPSGGGGAAGLTASACGAGGEGQVGASGSTIKAGQGGGGGASKQGSSAVGCAGGTGGQPGGGGGGGGGANLGAAGTGTATGGAGGNGGAGELWIWTYGSTAGPNSYTNTAAYSAIASTNAETYWTIGADGKLPAGVINTAGKRLRIQLAGIYGTNGITDTGVLKIKLCTVSGCGSGTVVTLATSGSMTPTADVDNQGWRAVLDCNVFTVGASGTVDCQGSATLAGSTVLATENSLANTATSTVDTTVDEYMSATWTWNNNSANNTITLRNFGTQIQ